MGINNNIQDFNQCVAIVLEQLYSAFPQPLEIDTWHIESSSSEDRTLYAHDDFSGANDDERKAVEVALDNYRWALEFLYSEGIVRDVVAEQKEPPSYTYATEDQPTRGVPRRTFILTSKGLALLNATPESIGNKQLSVIERIHDAIKSGSKEVISDTVIGIIASVASMGFSSQ